MLPPATVDLYSYLAQSMYSYIDGSRAVCHIKNNILMMFK